VFQASRADVVCPAGAADDPDALAHQRISDREKLASLPGIDGSELALEFGHAVPLGLDSSFLGLIGFEQTGYQRAAQWARELRDQVLCEQGLLVNCEPHA